MTIILKQSGKFFCSLFLLLSVTFFWLQSALFAQTHTDKPARVLFLLDASGSMAQPWYQQESRFEAASRIVMAIMDSIQLVNQDVSFGLRAFGEQYPAKDSNCYDTKLEVPFGFQNKNQMSARLNWLRPKGFSPIALSLREAAQEDFTEDNRYAYSIILITDGGESCGGDICATVQELLSKKISFTPYILTLVDYEPLQDEYNCLGKVLTVTQNNEIAPAVQKIMTDNRKFFSVKTIGLKSAPAPTETVIQTPAVRTRPVPTPVPATIVETEPTQPAVPSLPNIASINKIVRIQNLRKANLLFALPSIKPILIASNQSIITLPVPQEQPAHPVRNTPPSPPPNRPVATPQPSRPTPPVNKEIKKVDFYATVDNAEKTTLLVYFTDGNGKFYPTEPLMKFIDSKTGAEVKQLYRNMSGREPTPIEMTAGTYDIIIPGSDSKAENVVIQENKVNKVYIRAGMASLAFYYSTQPDSPITEYKAYVSNRFGDRKVTTQPCDQALLYEPANYHVEINTLPKLVYNLDLDFNQLKLVAIPTPGTFQILNAQPMEKAQLWHQLGNEYVPFLDMNITGRPSAQKVDLLPGFYQVRYFKAPHKPYDASVIVPFQIKSEETTAITLDN